ncbi:MAG: LEA type 2 family protein [Treponema sp.]|jgi:LEA14-like dessication related protein|nr:LEA type 2 family protein [Treponema sp.]
MKKALLLCPAAGIAALCILMLANSGCRTLEEAFREPLVSPGPLDITNLSVEGAELLCRIELENPNAIDIPFPEIGWEFFIEGRSFLSGRVGKGETLGARDSAAVDVPLSLGYEEMLDALGSLAGGGNADYCLSLEARCMIPALGERLWHFERRGKIPLPRMIVLRNPSLRIASLDFEGVDLICSLDIDNPNPFPLPFPEIHYHYAVQGGGFITGIAEFPGSLAAERRSPAEIRLRVAYSDLYRTFPALRNRGEAADLLSLALSVSLPGFGEEQCSLDIPGSLPLLKVPVLRFRGIGVKNIGPSGVELALDWDLENPNGFSLGVADLACSLSLNNAPWSEGKGAAALDIAPGGKASVPAAVFIDDPRAVRDLAGLISRGTDAVYSIRGTVVYTLLPGFSSVPVPFSFNGRTRLRP